MSAERRTTPGSRRQGVARNHVEREIRLPLHELADKRGALASEAFLRGGELTPDMEREWDAIGMSAREQIYRRGLRICEEEALVAGIDHELARLTERRRIKLNAIDREKRRLCEPMQQLGIRKVEGPLCTVTLQQNSTLTVERAAPTDPSDQPSLFAPHSGGTSSTRAAGAKPTRGFHVRVS